MCVLLCVIVPILAAAALCGPIKVTLQTTWTSLLIGSRPSHRAAGWNCGAPPGAGAGWDHLRPFEFY